MKKVHYLIWFALIAMVSSPIWGQTQKSWETNQLPARSQSRKGSPYVAGTGTTTFSLNNLPNIAVRRNPIQKAPALVTAESKDLYGFSMTNLVDESLTGLVKFNTATPDKVQHIGRSAEYVRAGAYANDMYYMIVLAGMYPKGLYTADITTGELTLVADYMYNQEVRGSMDMSYDYTTETMYMLTNSDNVPYTSALRTVNLETGEQTVITDDMGRYVRTLSINMEGEMFGIDGDGILSRIDKRTGMSTDIASTGREPFFFQTMEFDRETGVLYWLACDADHYSELCTVDPTNGTTTSLGLIGTGEGEQIVALYVPAKLCEDGAPEKVSALTAIADAKGSNKALISWMNPDKTYGGDNLTAIDKIEILRNGEVVKTLTGAEPGKKSEWTDEVAQAGIYTYKIVPHNSVGAGLGKTVSVYIGHDLPAAVNNAKAVRKDAGSISLSWDAATTGINNGYLDLASMRYKITRLNDKKVLSESQKETTFTDNTIEELARYTYEIAVSNADGEGGVTTTNYVVTGPSLDLPLKADFSKKEDADLWTCVDNNGDGNTFALMFNYGREATEYVYATSYELEADDWIVSPVVKLQSGKYYKVVVGAKCSFSMYPEVFSLYLIKDMNLDNAVKLGDDFVLNEENVIKDCRVNIDNAEGGEYTIGIRCTSPAASDYFSVTSVAIEENHDGTVRGDVWDNEDNPVENLTVSLEGTDFRAITNEKGEFEIKNVPAGDYTLRCTKLGYKDTPNKITIKELETKTVELDVTIRKEYTLSGVVKNEYGKSLPNVNITVNGYNTYAATTGADGTFGIEGVYEAEDAYQVTAEKLFYQKATAGVTITTAGKNIELTLADKILPPAIVTATIKEGTENPAIQWTQPGEEAEVILHSNAFSSTLGAEDGNSHTLLGILCKQPVMLKELNWGVFLQDETINVVILGMDESGNVTSDILYIDEEAPNVPYDATHYELKEPVIAPNGCFIGLSCDEGSLSLVTSLSTDEYPFVSGVNAVIDDYTQSTEVQFVENIGDDYKENFSLDYKGQFLADAEAPAVNYRVYRLDGNSAETPLTTSPVSERSLTDDAWISLVDGTYHYAVEAVYANEETSGRTESNSVVKGQSGIQDTETAKCYAEVSADGLQLLFSQEVDGAEIIAIDGTVVVKGQNVEQLSVAGLGEGIYIVRMKKGAVCHTQKVIIKK